MYKVGENRKCTEWPQTELEHLTVQTTIHTLNIYPWGPNFGPFNSTINRFRDTTYKISENRKCAEWPQTELEHLTGNITLYTLNTYPWGSNFWSVSLYDQQFPRCRTLYNCPLIPMLNVQNRTKTNCQKSKIWNFTNLYTTLVEILPRSMHEFLGVNLLCTFRGDDVVWRFFFLPYGPMLTKTKKKIVKNQKCKILKNKKIFWRYSEKVPCHQIWHQSAWRVLRKRVLRADDERRRTTTDGPRTTDACVTTVALLCSSTKQS